MRSFFFVLAIEVLSIGFRVDKAEGTHPHDFPHINCTGFCSPLDLECNETDGCIECKNNCNATLYDCTACVSAWEKLYYNDTGEVAYVHLSSDCFRATTPKELSNLDDRCGSGPRLVRDTNRNTFRTIYSCQCHENLCNKKLKVDIRPTSSLSIMTSDITKMSTQMFPMSTESSMSLPAKFTSRTIDVTISVSTQTRRSSVVFATSTATQSTSPRPTPVYSPTAMTASLPSSVTTMPVTISPLDLQSSSSSYMEIALVVGISVPVVTLLAITLVVFMVRRLRRYERSKEAEARDHRINSIDSYISDSGLGSGGSTGCNIDFQELHLESLLKRGRYGEVWKASFKLETVAVKIFRDTERNAWFTERDFLQNPSLAHDNIVQFIAADSRGIDQRREHWLVMAYYECGNLSDYLKVNVLTWNDMLCLSQCIVSAVAYLHSESDKHGVKKTSVAHRDIKSANVLVQSDHRCVLADFGMAIRLRDDIRMKDLANSGQCGTARYMAPEALDCRVNLEDLASFKQIDVYAMGLVLWEIANRCTHTGVRKYMLPYQDEVGSKPSVSTMRTVTLLQKKRPMIPQEWRNNRGMNIVAETIEECWDGDAEARLPAHCVEQRFQEILFPMYTIGLRTTSRTSSIATLRSLNQKRSMDMSETSFPDTIELPAKEETDNEASLPNSWKDEPNATGAFLSKRKCSTNERCRIPNQSDSGMALEGTENETSRDQNHKESLTREENHIAIHILSGMVLCNTMATDDTK